jgi:hypothetical protein
MFRIPLPAAAQCCYGKDVLPMLCCFRLCHAASATMQFRLCHAASVNEPTPSPEYIRFRHDCCT